MKRKSALCAVAGALSALAFGAFLSAQPAPPVETSTQPVVAVPPSEPPSRLPPPPPAHARRTLDSAAELARDLQEVVVFLEKGQAFLRVYSTGTHTVEENQAFLKFLETYEKELQAAKKESDALRKWVYEKGSLDSAAQP
ncbi:MAG: hypothetical protein WC728_15380 [Elusimicrobiota bacterium]